MPSLLRTHTSFRLFWFAQVVSQLGDRVHALALLWLVYHWTASGLAVGAVMIASSLPGILLGPVAGVLADRWDRRRIMIASDVLRAGIVGLLGFAAWNGTLDLAGLIAATMILSIGAALFNPAALSLVPALVPPAELTRASALTQVSATASGVIGPLLGSGLIAAIGVPLAFVANAASFIISGLLIQAMRAAPQPLAGHRGMWADLREGLRLLRGDALMKRLLLPVILCNFFFAALMVLIPILAEAVFSRGAVGMGMMTSSYMLGMLVGATALSLVRLRLPPGRLIVASMAAIGAAMLVMGAFKSFPLVLVGLSIVGLALSVGNIVLIAVYQDRLPPAERGKVFGLLTALSLSQQPIAYGITGVLAELFSPGHLLIVAGLGTLASGLSLLGSRELAALRPPEATAKGSEDGLPNAAR